MSEARPIGFHEDPRAGTHMGRPSHPATPVEAVAAAADVLVYHQRQGIKGCACGWSKPGRSFPEHQARLALEAAAPHLMALAWEQGREHGIDECAGDISGNVNPYRSAGAGE